LDRGFTGSLEDCQKGNAISTEDYMNSDQLQLIGYTDSDYARCIDNRKFISDYIFLIISDGGFSRKVITATL